MAQDGDILDDVLGVPPGLNVTLQADDEVTLVIDLDVLLSVNKIDPEIFRDMATRLIGIHGDDTNTIAFQLADNLNASREIIGKALGIFIAQHYDINADSIIKANNINVEEFRSNFERLINHKLILSENLKEIMITALKSIYEHISDAVLGQVYELIIGEYYVQIDDLEMFMKNNYFDINIEGFQAALNVLFELRGSNGEYLVSDMEAMYLKSMPRPHIRGMLAAYMREQAAA